MLIDTYMPIWWQAIQVFGWLEIILLFTLLPFERKHEYIYKAQRFLPDNPLSILVVILIGTPIIWAGIFAMLSYLLFLFILWLLTK